MKRVSWRRVIKWGVIPWAAVIICAALVDGRMKHESKWADASQENAEAQVKIMRHVQGERRAGAMVARIRRLSRGLIRQAQAVEIVRILRDKCDDSIRAERIMKIIDRESTWDPSVTGKQGEQGLMQIKPWDVRAIMSRLGVTNLYDPASNVKVGIEYLRYLRARLGDTGLAIAAYAGGADRKIYYAKSIMGE